MTKQLEIENKKLRAALERYTRELEIEAALERVRARTMAMQSSDELMEAANLLFREIQALGLPTWSAGYNILSADKRTAECWMSSEGAIQDPFILRFEKEASFIEQYEFFQGDDTFMIQEISGKALERHYDYMKTIPKIGEIIFELEKAGISLPSHQINHLCKFRQGYLLFITYEPVPDAHGIFLRFTRVFEQTYTRFLDLKKAEEQAREAQIEVALERVRSRAMAMQGSEELVEVTILLRLEMGLLGVEELETSSIYIHHEATGKTECWYSIQDRNDEAKLISDHMTIDLNDTWVGRQMLRFYRSGEEKTSIVMQGRNRTEWINYCAQQSDIFSVAGFYGEVIPERTYHLFKFSHGYMGAASPGEISAESWHLLRRATAVFSLAYTRFSDLKIAEKQAREAQIELALERVRARTMAMHNSKELLETGEILFRELSRLGVDNLTCGYVLMDKEKKMGWNYGVNPGDGTIRPLPTGVPWSGTKVLEAIFRSWQEQDPFLLIQLDPQETIEHQSYVAENSPNFSLTKEQLLAFSPERLSIHTFNFEYGYLLLVGGEQLRTEQRDMVMRFAKVFEMTYRRFLDLKKAEAQAREAQIEAALERIRAAAMAMKQPEDLLDIVVKMRTEFIALGHEAHYFWHMKWDPEKYLKAMTSGDGTRIGMVMELPRRIHAEIPQLARWEKSEEPTVVFVMDVEATLDYIHKMVEWGDFERIDPNMPSEEDIHHIGGLTYVMARTMHGEIGYSLPGRVPDPPQEDLTTLRRFADAFDLAFRRFEDLQKAEEQARKIKLVNEENERLLHSILPEQIVEQIRADRKNVVKRFEQVSILFADIVGFTVLSEQLSPGKVVDILNGLFSKFDDLTDQYGLEKIKTIGDAYMVAAGVPEERADHATTMFQFAQDMLRSLEEYNRVHDNRLTLRIGISSGPVVAGVIGKKKFAYDLWGDSVNTAARMEAYGRAGKIQVSAASYELLKKSYPFEKIPGVHIKGKGVMDVYLWAPG